MSGIFCFFCWYEFDAKTEHCPACGRRIDERLPYRHVLERALWRPQGPIAQRAAYLLGKLADPASIPVLERALADGDPIVAAEVVVALACIGTSEAQSLVEGALNHRYEVVRAAARDPRNARSPTRR